MPTKISADLMAPCGMNCGICMAFLRDKNTCPGCRNLDETCKTSCLKCKIKNCEELKNSDKKFCGECEKYPCDKVKHIDKRYRTKYEMSMIENLNKIKEIGLENFMKIENSRWLCLKCGNQICIHNKKCYFCEKKTK
jgi:hypothetical protein